MIYSIVLVSGVQFSSVQSLSRIQLFATPRTAARQASLSITTSRSLLKLMSIESVTPSSHLTLGRPLLLPPVPPSIRVFSNGMSASHEVAKVLEFQLQHQSFQFPVYSKVIQLYICPLFRFSFPSPASCVCKLHGHQQGPSAVLSQPLLQIHGGGGAGRARKWEEPREPGRGRSRESHGGEEPGVLPARPSRCPIYFLNFISPGREVVGTNSHKHCLYLKFF